MRLMEVDVGVEGMVVEVEGTVVEGEAEVLFDIVAGIECCYDTMKRIYLRLKRFNNGVHTMKHLVRSNECREKKRESSKRERKRENRFLERNECFTVYCT